MKNNKEIWENALKLLEPQLNEASYNAFFSGITITNIAETENKIYLSHENPLTVNILKSRYRSLIEKAFREIFDKKYAIVIQQSKEDKRKPSSEETFIGEGYILNPKYTFANFVVGENNKFANAAAIAVAEAPAEAYNPLFIYGGSGLGKTHLVHAIGIHILQNRPDLKVLYVSSEMFTNELIAAIGSKRTSEFKNKYRQIDVLLIDDIQFLEGKEATQEEFFYTFEALYELKKQIVITSDRPPNKLENIDERLRSRFQWNMLADISVPDYETRVAILIKKVESEGVYINEDLNDVINLISSKIKMNIRELEGAMLRVISFSKLMNENITVRFAKTVLKDLFSKEDFQITPESIKKKVAKYYGIKVSDMDSPKRSQNIVHPRQIAMYLCRELAEMSLPKIGDCFGGRDHTTVLHACDKISAERRNDENIRMILEHFEKEFALDA